MLYLNAEFFIGNRQKLAKVSGAKLIVIAANGLLQKTSTNTYDFHQDSSFFYLTGLEMPNVVLAINAVTAEEMIILAPDSDYIDVFADGTSTEQIAGISGITQVLDNKSGWQKLEGWAKEMGEADIIEPPKKFIEVYNMYTNPARGDLKKRLVRAGAKTKDIYEHIAALRVIKQPQELAALQAAIDVTAKTIEEITANIANYEFEYQLKADIDRSFASQYPAKPAFDTIVAGGLNAAVIHHLPDNSQIDKNQALMIDIGAEIDHYSADISRTFIPSTNKRAKEVYDGVMYCFNEGLKVIKPGITFLDYEKTMLKYYGQALVDLGVIDIPLDKNIRKHMPHATSHYLGLDTHDAGDYRQEFKAGMVITLEPGLYIPDEKIGIRVEDDILITEEGNLVLSSKIPQQLELK